MFKRLRDDWESIGPFDRVMAIIFTVLVGPLMLGLAGVMIKLLIWGGV